MSSIIIGTAGHIDHGKTSLVKHLTGVDLDRSPEEKERGITISLGFTHLDLPSGKRASFVDVPGHEKLVRTMISGATGLDAVLLCISAVEGVMPQTREHLAILNLLGIKHGMIAMTMTDVADAELMELAEMDIEDLVEGTFLEGAPILKTASGNKPSGHAELIQKIDALPVIKQNVLGPFRLPVDRVFIQKGFGTIVTGTARDGLITNGMDIELSPGGHKGRIRGIQVHGEQVDEAKPGQRVAINLAGIHHEQLKRGAVVMPNDTIPAASIFDCDYTHLENAPPIKDGSRVRFLSGSSEVLARITIIDSDEIASKRETYIQLRLEQPLTVLPGDRYVLRRESPLQTLGGGTIHDPWASKIRKRDKELALESLMEIGSGNKNKLLSRKGRAGATKKICRIWGVEGIQLDDRCYSEAVISEFCGQVLENLDEWHSLNPLLQGIQVKALHNRSLPHLSSRGFEGIMQIMIQKKAVEVSGSNIHKTGFKIILTDEQTKQCEEIIEQVYASKWTGVEKKKILQNDLLQLLLDQEKLLRIQSLILHPAQISTLKGFITDFFKTKPIMEPTDFKEISDLSRKYAIPMLEWFDQQGFTRRKGNGRILTKTE